MSQNRYALAAIVLACLDCSRAPTVPDNPLPPGAPTLGPTKVLADAPPPISGATLLVSKDGTTAVVADSDRDFVSLVDLATGTVRAKATLLAHDEPGRLAEDVSGSVYVALRGTGDLVTLSLASGQVTQRRHVCVQPRGVAYDAQNDQVLVACSSGELVIFSGTSDTPAQVIAVEPDLRDIVVSPDGIFISKFRTAEILKLDRTGAVQARAFLPAVGGSPALAWRMREAKTGELVASYQVDSTSFIPTTPGGYGGQSQAAPVPNPGSQLGGVIQPSVATISTSDLTMTVQGNPRGAVVLPVDIAVPPAGNANGTVALVAAGNWKSKDGLPYSRFLLDVTLDGVTGGAPVGRPAPVDGQIVAAAVGNDGNLLLQSREPALLYVISPDVSDSIIRTVKLSDDSREDTGHTIFHTNSGGSIACASCHGEGADDAQTWNFDGTKPRRTPSLLGTIKGTAPYHWDADFADMKALLHEVYTKRMGGQSLSVDQVGAVQGWVEGLPAPKRPDVDVAARARGEALFNGKAACETCHSGPSYTNNKTVDVGDVGLPLQVPPLLGVGARTPLLHAGCAATLEERFTKCATASHGNTQDLTAAETADLITFLKSL